ncbi:MAG: pyridoxal phosphate-dependent aminotransferase family protein [bacterium]
MSDLFEKCNGFTVVRHLKKEGVYAYFTELESEQAPEVSIRGKKLLMMGSNNYLGLASDPRMKQASIAAIEKYGTGTAGSRFLNGNTVLHTQLEGKLAKFKHREAALIYATGYQMNLGVVSCLVGRGDVAIVDKLDHASILDGCKLSMGDVRRYRHNDMEDLERILKSVDDDQGKLVIVDGVFSMEGDICPLPDIVRISRKYGARVMVDDAHATGVLGEKGRGTCEHFGMENGEVDIVVGTCSKSFASVGGFVVGDSRTLQYIQHTSRSMIFSAALPPSSVASISKAIDIIDSEPHRREQLWDNTKHLMDGFKFMGFDTGITATPIIPIMIGDDMQAFAMWKTLFEAGIFTNPIISPAVPPGKALIRVTSMATHTKEQMDRVLNAFEDCSKKLNIARNGRKTAVAK